MKVGAPKAIRFRFLLWSPSNFLSDLKVSANFVDTTLRTSENKFVRHFVWNSSCSCACLSCLLVRASACLCCSCACLCWSAGSVSCSHMPCCFGVIISCRNTINQCSSYIFKRCQKYFIINKNRIKRPYLFFSIEICKKV